jgi:hypothetical protein
LKYSFPSDYNISSELIEIDTALIPLVSGALLHFQIAGYWKNSVDAERGYNAFAKVQSNLMAKAVDRLILEIRALRGGDIITDDVLDPAFSPFDIPIETIASVKNNLDGVNQRLDNVEATLHELKTAIEASGTDVGDILTGVLDTIEVATAIVMLLA